MEAVNTATADAASNSGIGDAGRAALGSPGPITITDAVFSSTADWLTVSFTEQVASTATGSLTAIRWAVSVLEASNPSNPASFSPKQDWNAVDWTSWVFTPDSNNPAAKQLIIPTNADAAQALSPKASQFLGSGASAIGIQLPLSAVYSCLAGRLLMLPDLTHALSNRRPFQVHH